MFFVDVIVFCVYCIYPICNIAFKQQLGIPHCKTCTLLIGSSSIVCSKTVSLESNIVKARMGAMRSVHVVASWVLPRNCCLPSKISTTILNTNKQKKHSHQNHGKLRVGSFQCNTAQSETLSNPFETNISGLASSALVPATIP